MPSTIPEDLDVFRLPHGHMKQLVKDIEEELHGTNFTDHMEMHTLLSHLHQRFCQFKCHEEIETQYIVKELLPRLPSHAKATLDNDIHSDNRLSDLVTLVSTGLQVEVSGSSERQRLDFGEQLKSSITNFTVDFIPHMDEEEEVYLPLLLEYFSESELRKLTHHVLELHGIPESATLGDKVQEKAVSPSLLTLPTELSLQILSYLSPQDLLHLVPLHSTLYHLARDPALWQHLHPVRWAAGHWEFFKPPPVDDQKLLCNGLIDENNVTKELLSVGTKINANLTKSIYPSMSGCGNEAEEEDVQREFCVLQGVLEHILPHVGSRVLTLDLSHGKTVSNEVVFRMLRHCPNIRFLDLSYTKISDFAFRGLLCKDHHRWQLEHIDLSGCSQITDTALHRLSQSLATSPLPRHTPTSSSLISATQSCGWSLKEEEEKEEGVRAEEDISQLRCLILSGCHSITDVGLRSLATPPGLPHLHYLNLSGLPNVTPKGLSAVVSTAPRLPPDLLFYCENIMAGPYSDCANGCQNIGSSNLQCCRQDF